MVPGFTENKNHVYTIALAANVFMALALSVGNGRDGSTVRYYTHSLRLSNLSGGLLCRLSDKVLSELREFCWYHFELCMSTDCNWTASAIHRYLKSAWTKTALQYRFVSVAFKNEKLLSREENFLPAGKRAHGGKVASKHVSLPGTFVMYRNRVPWVSL